MPAKERLVPWGRKIVVSRQANERKQPIAKMTSLLD